MVKTTMARVFACDAETVICEHLGQVSAPYQAKIPETEAATGFPTISRRKIEREVLACLKPAWLTYL